MSYSNSYGFNVSGEWCEETMDKATVRQFEKRIALCL